LPVVVWRRVVVALPFCGLITPALAGLLFDAARAAINAHLAFNVAPALAGLPLLAPLAELTTRLLTDAASGVADRRVPRHLYPSALDTPSKALACAMRETLAMGDIVLDAQVLALGLRGQ
jgi:phosphate:Na+ symporter